MAFCTKCGKELRETDQFCFFCGEPVRETGDKAKNTELAQEVEQERVQADTQVNQAKAAGKEQEESHDAGMREESGSRRKWIMGGAAGLALIAIVLAIIIGTHASGDGPQEDPAQNRIQSGEASQAELSQSREGSVPAEQSTEDMLRQIIARIEAQSGFVTNSSWEPLAESGDFNGDGTQEFLAVYEIKNSGGIDVMYDVWSLESKGPVRLKSEVLFKEVGGNNGVVGIVNPGGKAYLAVYRYEPQGDMFNNYYRYIPWNEKESGFLESDIYLENHGNYNNENQGRYIMGDTAVEKNQFDARYAELTKWVYRLDFLGGGGDGGIKTFAEMKTDN